jgi:cytochrome P450
MSTRLSAVPGPTGRETALILATLIRDPLDVHVRLAARYGDAVRMPVGPHRSSFLFSRPEHAEHVFALNQDNYVKAASYRPLRALIGNGLLTSEGEEWRRHRRLIQPVFSRRDVTRFGPFMTDAVQRMLKRWEQVPDGATVNVSRRMSALTLDIVGGALFGADLTGDAAELARAMDAGQRIAVAAALLPLPWGPRSTRAVKAVARRASHSREGGVEGTVGRLIAARRARGSSGDPAGGDLLDILLAPDATSTGLTDAEVAAEVATFMLAGHETTANTLSWSLALLSALPAARVKLEREVDTVLGGRPPEAADLGNLPWTAAVVSEALRLYPPAWTVERMALADDEVAGVPVPAGSQVTIGTYLVHRHREFWPDPAGFDPGRFLAGTAATDRPRYAFIPFGGGRRACVGQSFAELEAVLVLAAIAQRYRLELTPRGIPAPVANVTLRPGKSLPMRLLRR